MNILGKLKKLFLFGNEEAMSHLIEKGRGEFRSFAPVYGSKGQQAATVGFLANTCDIIGTKGNVLGRAKKVYRMYKPSVDSILGKMNVYEVTTSKSPLGKQFESATIRKVNKGKIEFETINDRNEFKGYVRAMKINSGTMKI